MTKRKLGVAPTEPQVAPGCTRFAPKCTQCKTKGLLQNDSRELYHFLSHSTPLDSNFDTKLESSFLFVLAKSAHNTAYQAAYLQLGHESHPLLQNATSSSYRPDVAFPNFPGCNLTILPCGFIFQHPGSLFCTRFQIPGAGFNLPLKGL